MSVSKERAEQWSGLGHTGMCLRLPVIVFMMSLKKRMKLASPAFLGAVPNRSKLSEERFPAHRVRKTREGPGCGAQAPPS